MLAMLFMRRRKQEQRPPRHLAPKMPLVYSCWPPHWSRFTEAKALWSPQGSPLQMRSKSPIKYPRIHRHRIIMPSVSYHRLGRRSLVVVILLQMVFYRSSRSHPKPAHSVPTRPLMARIQKQKLRLQMDLSGTTFMSPRPLGPKAKPVLLLVQRQSHNKSPKIASNGRCRQQLNLYLVQLLRGP
jgi:hypothetical protein